MFFRKILGYIKSIVAKNRLAFILILIAAFLRLYRIEEFVTFLGDQGRDAVIIRRIITFEHFPAIGAPSSIGQIYLGPFYYYLITPFLWLFNYNSVGLAYGVAFFSLVALVLIYFFVKREINFYTALVSIFFITFSYVNIDISRYSWNPNLLPVFSFFTLYFFYKTLKTKNALHAILFGSFLSFAIQLHYLAVILALSIGTIGIKEILWSSNKTGYLKTIIYSLLAFITFSSPLIVFDLRHEFLNTNNFIKLFKQGTVISDNWLSRFIETNGSFFNHVFKIQFNPLIALLLFLTIAVLGYLLILRKKNNLLLKLNFLNVIFFIIAFSFLNSQRHPHYYGTIYYSFFVALAYFITFFSMKSLFKYIFIPSFLIIYLVLNLKDNYFIFGKGSYQIAKAKNIANSIAKNIDSQVFQLVPLPSGETDGHVRYFLEINGYRSLEENSDKVPNELFILCFAKECYPILGNPQWQIASFLNGKIAKIWKVEDVTVYKLIH